MPGPLSPRDHDQHDPVTPDSKHTPLAEGGSPGAGPGRRRMARRAFLALAVGGVFMAGCQREQIVYVSSPVPTATAAPPTPVPAPTPQPTAPPAPAQRQGPVVLAPPIPGVPVSAMQAQAQVIPQLPTRTRPYTNWLQPPDRLQIPSIGLDSKIIPLGTKFDPRGFIAWETAAFAVGYHRGSGLPGENGNTVLSGHISSPHEGNVFTKLPKVEVGDGIVVSTPDRQYLYVVADIKTVTPDAIEVLDPSDHAIATLLTCVPDGIYSHRLVVRADAV